MSVTEPEADVDPGDAGPRRRRCLDRAWQVEQETDFESRTALDSHLEASKEQAIAELRCDEAQGSEGSHLDSPPPSAPSGNPPGHPLGGSGGPSLRRLKQVEADVAYGIEKECGINVSRGVDVFRLVLTNPQSSLRSTTRVLLVSGEAFVFAAPGPRASHAPVQEESQSWIQVNLHFFRAAARGPLPQRLGSLPVLHVVLRTSDGLEQAMEFVGVHQRRYLAEDVATDAISQHLTESLLRVALEFVFHPSRTRFSKDLVMLRECSASAAEAQLRREHLPRMAETLRSCNEKVKEVLLEFANEPPTHETTKEKSFVVLDEDVLKVSPAKEQFKAPANPAFKGLKQGFLNGKAKQTGLSKACPELPPAAAQPEAAPAQGQRRISTSQEEKRQLLLPAAERPAGAVQAQALVSSLRAEPEEPEEEPEELGPGLNISDLATQLFGVQEVPEEEPEVPTEAPPASGVRLWQQMRREREREERALEETCVAEPRSTESPDDLVALWMKQRW